MTASRLATQAEGQPLSLLFPGYTKVQLSEKEISSTPKGITRSASAKHGPRTAAPGASCADEDRTTPVYGVAELRSVPGDYCPSIQSISAVIARSQIVTQPCRAGPSLPAGFNHADIAVLDWIAAEAGRAVAREAVLV